MIAALLSAGTASAGAPTSNDAEAATYTGIHAKAARFTSLEPRTGVANAIGLPRGLSEVG
jgi:hypothetical protein